MLHKLSIAKRLALGFGVVLLLLLVVAASGYWGMQSVANETISMLRGDSKLAHLSDAAKAHTLELRRFEKDTFLNIANKSTMKDYEQKWHDQLTQTHAVLAELESLASSIEDRQLITEMNSDVVGY